jgi:hypothetical protein
LKHFYIFYVKLNYQKYRFKHLLASRLWYLSVLSGDIGSGWCKINGAVTSLSSSKTAATVIKPVPALPIGIQHFLQYDRALLKPANGATHWYFNGGKRFRVSMMLGLERIR